MYGLHVRPMTYSSRSALRFGIFRTSMPSNDGKITVKSACVGLTNCGCPIYQTTNIGFLPSGSLIMCS